MELKLIGYFSSILQFHFHVPEIGKRIYLERSCLRKRPMARVQVIISLCNIRTLLLKSSGLRGTILSNKGVLSGVPARPGAIHTVLYHAKMDVAVMDPAWEQFAPWWRSPGTDSLLFISCLISMIPWWHRKTRHLPTKATKRRLPGARACGKTTGVLQSDRELHAWLSRLCLPSEE